MANSSIGVRGWRNYSLFSLFGAGSQRADRQTNILVDTYSGNLSVLSTDWILAARIPCVISRSYNHQDDDDNFDRPFGPGWNWQFDMNLTGGIEGNDDVTWKAADGSEYVFEYNNGVWTAPAGMHQCKLTFDGSGTPDVFTLKIGRMSYIFEVNDDEEQDRARLVQINDAYGNALQIQRTYSNSKPTATIEYIKLRYYNGSTWTTRNLVQPTYSSGRISQLRLLDTVSGGDYLDLHYTYTSIDGASRLTKVEPKFGSTALNMEVVYGYDPEEGLKLQKVYDSLGNQAGTPYYWTINYNSNVVSSIVFPVESGSTGTVTYTYATSEPTDWSHADPSSWTKVTDALSNDWYYGHNSTGTVYFSVDPLWVNSTHESYTEYAYNADLQVTSVKSPKPNAESGQLTTSFYYNSDKNPAAVVDAYGFVSWFKYGSRASYDTSGTGATVSDVIGVFSPYPNQKAYADNDHTASETTAPSLSSPVNVDSFVSWDTTNLYWKYTDGSGSPKTIQLVRSVMDYAYEDGTGKLKQLLSCSPENFAEGTASSYTLTSASACSCQVFGSVTSGTVPTATIVVTNGDMLRSYTPSQFKDANLKWTAYTYDQTFGVVTEVEGADSLVASAGKKTKFTYNTTKTRVTKVEQPQDNTNQWQVTTYDDRLFATGVQKKDIANWSVDPIVSVSVYDNNGQLTQSWQADPDYVSTPRWNGNTANGYDKVRELAYDRLGRVIQSDTLVDWNQDNTVETLSTYFTYDLNGNQTRVKGPAYAASGSTYYTYNFTTYDDTNRVVRVYNAFADTDSNPAEPLEATPFTEYLYDIAGNAKQIRDPLYDPDASTLHVTTTTFDWLNRGIKTARVYAGGGGDVTVSTEQHFSASGGAYWSADATGYKMYPEQDKDGRLYKLHRGSSGGDADERTYDYDGRVLYQYSYDDVSGGKVKRQRNKFDELGRLVNSGREQYTGGSWQNWNSNTAESTFNYNGAIIRTYDKVNTGKYSESVYNDWGLPHSGLSPIVYNVYADGAGITSASRPANSVVPSQYELIYANDLGYDVLGRRITSNDEMDSETAFSFDLLGRVILATDDLDYENITYFDARGLKSEVHTSGGAVHKYTYDERGLLSLHRVTHDSQDDDTSYTYNALGQLTQVDHPDGGITKYEYDALGRRTKLSVLLSGSDYLDTTYTYDANGRMLTMTSPGSLTWTFHYDSLGNMDYMDDPQSLRTSYTYDADNRRLTVTQPNGTTQGLITTYAYDWKTGQVSSITYERNATSGDDITVSYGYDDNGRVTSITDGRGQTWSKTYDAMGRMTGLTTPVSPTGAHTHHIYYDGNGNIYKTTDFKGTDHFYQYDALGRMTGHGADVNADDETYTWVCCTRLSAYTDALGTASLSYDGLNRLTSFTDSNGNNVAYEYDTLGRIAKLTPAQGTNYRTEYTYNKNGSVSQVRVYDAGSSADTTYTYSTSSGRLTERNFPTVSSTYIKTAYSYDAYGRLEYETVTRESGGTTNLYRTQYAYSRLSFGIQMERIEQNYSGSWANSNKTQYQWDTLGRQTYEERFDYVLGNWVTRYDITQAYDKNGNRTGYDKDVVGGYESSYGKAYNLSYTFDNVNALSAIADADDGNYSCTVTSDLNLNITLIEEKDTRTGGATLYTYFDYDALNRLTAHRTKRAPFAGVPSWLWTKRSHYYDATGRLVKSNWKTWTDGQQEPSGNTLEHIYAGDKHVQNYDGTNYGAVWHWAGAANEHMGPLNSPNADTASQKGYNLSRGGVDLAAGVGGSAGGAGGMEPQSHTYLTPTTEGDKRNLFGQGRPMAKDSAGSGSAWATGTTSQRTGMTGYPVESRLMFEGTVTGTDMSRATDAREKDRIGILGTGLSYAGSYGRVTSESIGRDLNPLGRGDGDAYVAGTLNLDMIAPSLPLSDEEGGTGNSINNFIDINHPQVIDSPSKTSHLVEEATKYRDYALKQHRGCGWGSKRWKAFHDCAHNEIINYLTELGQNSQQLVYDMRHANARHKECVFATKTIKPSIFAVLWNVYVAKQVGSIGDFFEYEVCKLRCEAAMDVDPKTYANCMELCELNFQKHIRNNIEWADVNNYVSARLKLCHCMHRLETATAVHKYLHGNCEAANFMFHAIIQCPHSRRCCPVCKRGLDCNSLYPDNGIKRMRLECANILLESVRRFHWIFNSIIERAI